MSQTSSTQSKIERLRLELRFKETEDQIWEELHRNECRLKRLILEKEILMAEAGLTSRASSVTEDTEQGSAELMDQFLRDTEAASSNLNLLADVCATQSFRSNPIVEPSVIVYEQFKTNNSNVQTSARPQPVLRPDVEPFPEPHAEQPVVAPEPSVVLNANPPVNHSAYGADPVEPQFTEHHVPLPHSMNQPDYQMQFHQFLQAMTQQMNINRLPPPEPGVFSGDPLTYPTWKTAFLTLIKGRGISSGECIHYLKKYLSGIAKEAVEGYLLLQGDHAYEAAWALLEKRFGDPFVIANAFREKLETWVKIPSRDGKALRKFGDFLRQCHSAMAITGSQLSILNDERENRKMLLKLPDWMVNRWGREVHYWKEHYHKFPPFLTFVGFVEREAEIACDPVTSVMSMHKSSESTPGAGKSTVPKSETRRSLITEATTPKPESQHKPRNCLCCNKQHELNDCPDFVSKSLEDRKQMIQTNALCFGCLKRGHKSKDCKRRLKCKTCERLHPTSIHEESRRQQENPRADPEKAPTSGISHANECFSGDGSKSSMILPVWLSTVENPSAEVLVYAMLDTQSDTTFLLDEVCTRLGVKGDSTNLLLSTMSSENELINTMKVKGLEVRGMNSDIRIPLPTTYTRNLMPVNRAHIPTPDIANRWPHLTCIAPELLPLQSCPVGLLIGYNCPRALAPREVISEPNNEPYAQRTDLGWGIVGIVGPEQAVTRSQTECTSHRVITFNVTTGNHLIQQRSIVFPSRAKEVIRVLEADFNEKDGHADQSYSVEDTKFLQIMDAETRQMDNGHFEMPLPFKDVMPVLPDNRDVVIKRLLLLDRKFKKHPNYKEQYVNFMKNLVEKGFAEKVPSNELDPTSKDSGHQWYIPHFGVFHPKKPEKIRVVFDCSAKYYGTSLNDHLLQGPDLTNSLLGVLCRFRQERIAFICDVEQMFHQFVVANVHRNYLRFLWWEDGDTTKTPTEYRMTVHLFGARSSPSCCSYGLKRIADTFEEQCGTEATNFVKHSFYVDDGLGSVPTVKAAKLLIQNTRRLCQYGGLHLHKFVSNSSEVLSDLPPESIAQGIANLPTKIHDATGASIERALGVYWCIENDTLQFRIMLKDKPLTRRAILSTIGTVYDPLGIVAPVLLLGRQILQELCQLDADWDTPLPEYLHAKWCKWRADLPLLEQLTVQRCLKPDDDRKIKSIELHHFSDASELGYGQCSYARMIDDHNQIHCSFIMGKSRVAPLKTLTIPRLELAAAVVSVNVSATLRRELDYEITSETFWTDSEVTLGYVSNESKKFHVFVANRVQHIRDKTEPCQWRHVSGNKNPADEASRGLTPQQLLTSALWIKGPSLLWESKLPNTRVDVDIKDDDPEVKQSRTMSVAGQTVPQFNAARLERFSSWFKVRAAVGVCLRYRDKLLAKVKGRDTAPDVSCVQNLHEAETVIIKAVQAEAFKEEIRTLKIIKASESSIQERSNARNRNVALKRTSSLYRMDPFLDKYGVLRVGGRIRQAQVDIQMKHPVILPKNSHITSLILHHCHEMVHHGGRSATINSVRQQGYWAIGCRRAVSSLIGKCVRCRRLRTKPQSQKMADLPVDRLEPAPCFTYCGTDVFGPWYVKEGRSQVKRYGLIFTCLVMRAVHLETINSMTTDSFINALRRLIAVRGTIKLLRCDCGTNFVGADNELSRAWKEMDFEVIRKFLLREECDIEFRFNVPSASNRGGVWERQIRSARTILTSMLLNSGTQLDDESLRTLMYEVMAIINGRPLTTDDLEDPTSLLPLTPNQLLTMKSRVIVPPPGNFPKEDLMLRKRWRRVQYLANIFWTRWRKEYLHNLQARQKWTSVRDNVAVGDIVTLKEDETTPRNLWRLARVENVQKDNDGLVRTVRIALGDKTLDKKGKRSQDISYLDRPVQKLVLIYRPEH